MYRWIDHTAEAALEVDAPTEEGVFGEALRALAELLGGDGAGEPVTKEIAVEADDRGALLVAWLSELVFLAETEAFVPGRVTSIALSDTGLAATVDGRRSEPRFLVKAITYSQLRFERHGYRWQATVVVDV